MSMPLEIVDSHTEGEPTRVVTAGWPELGCGTMAAKAARLRREHDWLRSSLCHEPRGHEAMVGALLCQATEPDCCCGAIFFNNADTLQMCIHATIGVVVTLAHLGRIGAGTQRIDTPVGVVTACLEEDGRVSVENVPSYRWAADVELDVAGWGRIRGDVAWGGNWFFLIEEQGPELCFENIEALKKFTSDVRRSLTAAGITGADGAEIDHIECFAPPTDPQRADSMNFVLCPGMAYDRSPCGTGTSAKLACMHAAGKIAPGQIWRQAGILNTVFEGSIIHLLDDRVLPRISGRAWITGESRYHFHPDDPFRYGIPAKIT